MSSISSSQRSMSVPRSGRTPRERRCCAMTRFSHQGTQHALLDADGRHLFTSSNRATGVRTQRPAGHSSRLHPASLREGVRVRARRCLTGQGRGGERSCLLVASQRGREGRGSVVLWPEHGQPEATCTRSTRSRPVGVQSSLTPLRVISGSSVAFDDRPARGSMAGRGRSVASPRP